MNTMFDGDDRDQQRRGEEAARILQSDAFRIAEDELKQDYRDKWEGEADPAARDRLWHEAKVVDALRRKLEAIQANGEHSGERLRRDAARETAGR